jgi:outer membrane protein OmpA-like peptidoglycan-associated protein
MTTILALKRLTAASLVGLLALLLTACDTPPPPDPGATAFVHAARSNSAAVDTTKVPYLSQVAFNAARRTDTITVVTTDGEPSTSASVQLRNDGNSDTIREQQDGRNKATVLSKITAATAETGEANPLQAIAVAADSIRRSSGPKLLVVLDSGLSTTAPLRFQDNLLNPRTDPAQVAAFVQSVGSVPDLTGIDVVWIGLGQTRVPQEPLNTPAKEKAKAIWSATLNLGAPASLTFVDDGLPTVEKPEDAPAVTVVPVPQVDSYKLIEDDPVDPPAPPVTAPFQADQLGFQPDSAELVDPQKTQLVIADTAARLVDGGHCDIHIQGTTADVGDIDGQIRQGADRATKIRDLLITAGVPSACITSVEGVGSDFAGFVTDRNPDGSLNEAAAARNRLVIVTAGG